MLKSTLLAALGAASVPAFSPEEGSRSVTFVTSDQADVTKCASKLFFDGERVRYTDETFECERRRTQFVLTEDSIGGAREREIARAARTWTIREPSGEQVGVQQEWVSPFVGVRYSLGKAGELGFVKKAGLADRPKKAALSSSAPQSPNCVARRGPDSSL